MAIHAGAPPYNPVPNSPSQAPQARHTPSQSPERASDPLAFLQAPPVAQSQAPRQRTTVAAGRKTVKAAFQPYQPPIEGLSLFPPPQQQAKVHFIAALQHLLLLLVQQVLQSSSSAMLFTLWDIQLLTSHAACCRFVDHMHLYAQVVLGIQALLVHKATARCMQC